MIFAIAGIAAAAPTELTIELLLNDGEHFSSVTIDYHEGLRFPHLVRDDSDEASLDQILRPKRSQGM